MTTRKVFTVSSGMYSDYHIVCVFTTRELAEEYVARQADQDEFVEEYELLDTLPEGRAWYRVSMTENDDEPTVIERWCWADSDSWHELDRGRLPVYHGRNYSTGVAYATADGLERERCIKAVVDRIMRAKYEREQQT